jgi:ketosteroid isomerase-like protein
MSRLVTPPGVKRGQIVQRRSATEKESTVTTNAQPFTSLKKAVDQIRHQHVAAVNAGDAEVATNLFGPEGIFLPPGQPALEGTPAIRVWFTHVFANFRVVGFGLQPRTVEQHGDVIIEHGNWQATFQPKDASPGLPAGGTYLTVYARLSDGSVRIIRDTFNGMPG